MYSQWKITSPPDSVIADDDLFLPLDSKSDSDDSVQQEYGWARGVEVKLRGWAMVKHTNRLLYDIDHGSIESVNSDNFDVTFPNKEAELAARIGAKVFARVFVTNTSGPIPYSAATPIVRCAKTLFEDRYLYARVKSLMDNLQSLTNPGSVALYGDIACALRDKGIKWSLQQLMIDLAAPESQARPAWKQAFTTKDRWQDIWKANDLKIATNKLGGSKG